MMFDGAQFFRGLTAWFSTSVSARQKSLWIMKGGLENHDFLKADYIFSSNAAAHDTMRIFASSKYESEELTVFHSSLIEDCVTNHKGSLNCKYIGGFVLIQPQYQKELESFQTGKCPRIYSPKRANGDIMRGSHPIGIKKGTERHNEDSSDEWDFVDESHAGVPRLSDMRRLSREQLNSPAKENHTTSVKEHQPSNSYATDKTDHSTGKHKAFAHQGRAGRDLYKSLKETSYSTQKHSTTRTDQRRHRLYDSSNTHNTRNRTDSDKSSWRCPEDCRKINSSSQPAGSPMEIDLCLPDENEKQYQVENNNKRTLSRAGSISPTSFKVQFLSSMDNGFLHVDDIDLPDIPIDDFVPNMNGCRVEFK